MKKTLILFAFFFSIVCPEAFGATWYVDNVATGSNNGTSWANAWKSFASINWASLSPGDTLYISGGSTSKTYNETLTISKGGSSGNILTISTGLDAGHNGTVIINGQSTRTNAVAINGASYVKLTGQVGTSQKMKLTGAAGNGLDLGGAVTNTEIAYLEVASNGASSDTHGIGAMINYNKNYNNEIHHCLVHDNYQDGMNLLQSNAGEATQFGTFRVHDNKIYNINDDGIETSIGIDFFNNEVGPRIPSGGRGHPDSVQFYNSYSRVYNNYIHGFVITADPQNSNSNIFFDPCDASITLNPKYVYVYNNLLVETATPGSGDVHRGIAMKFAEPGVASANNILVANNTLVGIPYFGLSLTMASLGTAAVSNIAIENNIFKDIGSQNPVAIALEKGNGTITYGSHGTGKDVTIDYNLYYASSGTYKTDVDFGGIVSMASFKSSSGCESHGGLLGNPLLSGTYGLGAGSPAIGAGISLLTYFSTDKDNVERPIGGSPWSIGAYEGPGLQAPKNLRIQQ